MTITPSIILRALEHDTEALDLLVEAIDQAMRPAIGIVLRQRRVSQLLDAKREMDELLQEVFLKLWEDDGQRLRAWLPARASFATYVGTIAANHAKDRYNRRQEQLSATADNVLEPPPDSEDPQERAANLDYHKKIFKFMKAEQKNAKQKKMFHLMIELGLNVNEICLRTGMTHSAVYKWPAIFSKQAKEIRKKISSTPAPPQRKKK